MAEKSPTRRARQAQETREEILRAARRLFAERGYTRTSIRDIADAAGVSAQTVYDSVGAKQVLVARLNDLIDAEAGIGEIVATTMAGHDPRAVAAMSARVTRSMLEHCGDIVHALVSGSAAEPALATALDEGHRRHVDGAALVVRTLQDLGALDGATGGAEATETLAAVTDFRFALVLRESYGWSLDRIEEWMTSTSQALLLATSAGTGRP